MLKRILQFFNYPAPTWLVAILFALSISSAASATIFLFQGSVVVPSGGTLNDSNATVSRCAGYDASKNIKSATSCFDTAGTGLGSTGTTVNLTVPVAVANGGTGSTTQNFVDLTTTQTVNGAKTFGSGLIASSGINITGSGQWLGTGANANAGTAITFPNADGAGYITYLGSLSTATVLGNGCNDLRVGQWNGTVNADDFCIDNNGNSGLRGAASAKILQSAAGGTTLAEVPPCYASNGAGCNSGGHVHFTTWGAACTTGGANTCDVTVTLSGATFTSASTVLGCWANGPLAGVIPPGVFPMSGSQIDVHFSGTTSSQALTTNGVCMGF